MRMACGCCSIVPTGPESKEFVVECIPANTTMPEAHKTTGYICFRTKCHKYQPKHSPLVGKEGFGIWPVCVCGALAQDHE
jgi:hypothetical protein